MLAQACVARFHWLIQRHLLFRNGLSERLGAIIPQKLEGTLFWIETHRNTCNVMSFLPAYKVLWIFVCYYLVFLRVVDFSLFARFFCFVLTLVTTEMAKTPTKLERARVKVRERESEEGDERGDGGAEKKRRKIFFNQSMFPSAGAWPSKWQNKIPRLSAITSDCLLLTSLSLAAARVAKGSKTCAKS